MYDTDILGAIQLSMMPFSDSQETDLHWSFVVFPVGL
jgi:hypothetical protein